MARSKNPLSPLAVETRKKNFCIYRVRGVLAFLKTPTTQDESLTIQEARTEAVLAAENLLKALKEQPNG